MVKILFLLRFSKSRPGGRQIKFASASFPSYMDVSIRVSTAAKCILYGSIQMDILTVMCDCDMSDTRGVAMGYWY